MAELTIGETAARVGLRPSTLRYYESIGLLPAAARVSGRRRYGPDAVRRLRLIAAAKDIGFSLDEIGVLLDGLSPTDPPSERWQAVAAARLPALETFIAQAQAMQRILAAGLRCECVTMDDCFAALG